VKPLCHAKGCMNLSDPRFSIHGPNGKAVSACDGHGNPGCSGNPCTCPPHDGRGAVPEAMTEAEWAQLKQVTWFREEQDRVIVEMDLLRRTVRNLYSLLDGCDFDRRRE
jgi:hypothetical protein